MSMTPFKAPLVSSLTKEVIKSLLQNNLRPDGTRDLATPRNISIKLGVIEKAEGSAHVTLGKTQVIAGVKVDVGTPFRDTPNQGVLMVHAEFVPLASPLFEPGPPDENAVELARVIDRSLREVKAIDLESLVIREGEKVWMIWVDLYIIDHGGNLFDASMLAAMAALLNTWLPDYEELETGEIIVKRGSRSKKLKIDHKVVTVTLANIDGHLVVDPDYEEEAIADSRLVIAFDEDYRIVGIQKTGEGAWKTEEIKRALSLAKNAAGVYFRALEESLKEEEERKDGKEN